jgi:O-antigen biosynthesis protein WbqP
MYTKVKRIFDIFFSIVLIIFLMPIFFLIGLIIKLQDQGPSIFKQLRVGENGKYFQFYKFRSMPVNTPNVESKDTGRINVTPFGIFIRRTNLDELPQLFNILIGDMSFVGPRPPIPTQRVLIDLRISNSTILLKPGLTGWAQVNSYDFMSDEVKAKLDKEYYNNISFSFDLKILFKTFLYLFSRPPIY